MHRVQLAVSLVLVFGQVNAIDAQDETLVPAVETRRVQFTLVHRFIPGPETKSVTWTVVVPSTLPNRQVIHELEYSMKPHRIFERQGHTYAVFVLEDLSEPMQIDFRVTADLMRCDFETLLQSTSPDREIEKIDEEPWLKRETFLETDAPSIQVAASTIEGASREERVRNTLRFVATNLEYSGFRAESLGASRALEEQSGDCSEFSDLFVALCRAQGIPARTCDGQLIIATKPGDTSRHKWAEVHFDELGWVPIDPLQFARSDGSLRRLPNEYLYLSHLRNDPTLNYYELAFYRFVGDPIEFENELVLHEAEER
jgi:transglutaminase-like putative cysteine protease